jgi:hypothetical protein
MHKTNNKLWPKTRVDKGNGRLIRSVGEELTIIHDKRPMFYWLSLSSAEHQPSCVDIPSCHLSAFFYDTGGGGGVRTPFFYDLR